MCPNSETKVSITATFTLLHSSTNQKLFKKYLCNQSYYEKCMWCHFCLKVKYPLHFFVSYAFEDYKSIEKIYMSYYNTGSQEPANIKSHMI